MRLLSPFKNEQGPLRDVRHDMVKLDKRRRT